MTNFENMRQKIIEKIMELDEMELLCLAEDTEMAAGGLEGVFNCTVCEEEYGECDVCPCTREHSAKYLQWCRKEIKSERNSKISRR